MQQCCVAHIVHSMSTILFSIVTSDCGLIQAKQCLTILFTTMNNVGSTTLFSTAFNHYSASCLYNIQIVNMYRYELQGVAKKKERAPIKNGLPGS